MKTHYLPACLISLSLISVGQTATAASLQKTAKNEQTTAVTSVAKDLSPLEKAVNQQKRERYESKIGTEAEQLKINTSIKTAASQNFLAAQHQQFSKLLQSLFPQHSS